MGAWGCGWEKPMNASPLHLGSQGGSCSHLPPAWCSWEDKLTVKMPPLKMLCLGSSHQQLCLAGLSLPLLPSASAFLTYSTDLYGKDKPNNATENSHNSLCYCSSSADRWLCQGCPASSPVWPDSINCSFKKWLKILTQAQLEGCEALQKSLQPAGPVVSKKLVFLTLGDTFHMCFQGLLVTKPEWARNRNIWAPVFENIL